jgi:methylase of polypeptide subunit release factors
VAATLDDRVEMLDPGRVLADHEGCAALTELVSRLRVIGYDGSPDYVPRQNTPTCVPTAPLVALASCRDISEGDAVNAIGSSAVTALTQCGALARTDRGLRLTARVFPMRSVYTLVPRPQPGEDTVYLGPDSLVLFEIIWSARGYGDLAVDLATGNGFIAAALATRYDHVIAADLSHRCASTAALVPVINPHLRARFATVQTDIADGLRSASFDLVTANTPWVPETVGPDGGPRRRFAAGGPTGFELPRRFIDAAADLLAPGGRAFIACLDIGFDDGTRPLLDHVDQMNGEDVQVTITETRLNQTFDYGTWARHKAPRAASAAHVVVELRRSP